MAQERVESPPCAKKGLPPSSEEETVIFPYQQNGKTLAIRQPNDRVASVSTRFRVFFGDGAAVPVAFTFACEYGVNLGVTYS
jgi:hypothetical protein